MLRKLVAVTLLAIGATWALGACTQEGAPIAVEPEKPASVPTAAHWVGGIDGGVFVLVERPHRSDSVGYRGEIYYSTGDVVYSGPMKLQPKGAEPIDPNDRTIYLGWDGDSLLLSRERVLKVVE